MEPEMQKNKRILIWASSVAVSFVVLFFVIANWDYFTGFFNLIISLFRI